MKRKLEIFWSIIFMFVIVGIIISLVLFAISMSKSTKENVMQNNDRNNNSFSEYYEWETCDDEYILMFSDYGEIIIDNDYDHLEYRLDGNDLYIILYEQNNGDIFEFKVYGDYTFSCIEDR